MSRLRIIKFEVLNLNDTVPSNIINSKDNIVLVIKKSSYSVYLA